MASIDLKHAYYTIPIAEEQRKFLKFVWNEQLYEFCVLPMGLKNFHQSHEASFGYYSTKRTH
jgi:hypothetical protein